MSEYQEFTGKSVEEAIKAACDAFGVGLADLDFEILTPGSRGVLGMGAEPARIVAAPRSALGGAAPKREAAESKPLPPPPRPRGPRPARVSATGRRRPAAGRPAHAATGPAPRRPPARRPPATATGPPGDRGPRRDDRPAAAAGDHDRGPRRDDRARPAPDRGRPVPRRLRAVRRRGRRGDDGPRLARRWSARSSRPRRPRPRRSPRARRSSRR